MVKLTQEKQVPTGYKRTEIGVLPSDWTVAVLREIADVKTGPFGSSLHERDYVPDGTPIITVEHLGERGVIHENLPMVSDSDKRRLSSYSLRTEDIVFSRVGSVDRNSLVGQAENGWLFSGRLLRIRVTDENTDPQFLSYYFHQEPFKQRVRTVAVGQTMASLNTQILKSIKVALAGTKAEQSTIAAVLSDTDALIESLEKLIAKKRAIKQGAMQEYLTGKRRLPGFGGEWSVKKLGMLGQFRGGNGFPIRYQGEIEGDYPFYKVSDMNNEGNSTFMSTSNNWVSKQTCKVIGAKIFPAHTVVLAKIGAAIFLERKKLLSQDSCIDNNMMGLVLYEDQAHFRFVHYLLLNIKLGKFVSATALPSLNGRELAQLEYNIPPVPEQVAIADVIADMDIELDAIEQRLTKYKLLKEGMMQLLLTGKIRLLTK